jgi:23S rRNA (pseudouridine1915-N3)-methyltransferase
MRIVVLQRGKIRDDAIASLRDEYLKRFRKYGELNVLEKPESSDESIFPAGRGYRVALDEKGKSVTSLEFAKLLERWTMTHTTVFLAIGSAYGHSAATVANADAKLSLGPLTLAHQLAHLVLIEQIYRAASILRGDPYHHG